MTRDSQAPCTSIHSTGMAWSVLSEVAQRLKDLAEHNQPSSIDLRSLPMTDADREQLKELLGWGEVAARLEIGGPTDIHETTYCGVWWIRHMGAGGVLATEEIAITRIPEIFLSDPHDVSAAAERIRTILDQGPARPTDSETPHVQA